MSTRVIVVDDHAMLRDLLSTLLENHGFTVAGVAGDGAEAVRVTRSLKPDVVIMDLSMPVMNGIDAGEEIRRDTGIPVILLTMHSEQHHVVQAFRAGLAAYVLKSRAAADLLLAIAEVIRGNVYMSPGISDLVVREMLCKSRSDEVDQLTLSERKVLHLVAEGKSTRELACLLSINVRTAEAHRSRIMEKLKIHEIAGLVRYAVREGLIEA
jgi:two-component system response regulator NreC